MTKNNEQFIKFCEENGYENAIMVVGTKEKGFSVSTNDFAIDDFFLVSIQTIFENTHKSAHETGEILAENLPAYIRGVAEQYAKAEKKEEEVGED